MTNSTGKKIKECSSSSEMAMACYNDLFVAKDGVGNRINENHELYSSFLDKNIHVLGKKGDFSKDAAKKFLLTHEVIYQYPNDEEGFSLTVFKNNQTGKYTVAIRGTEFDTKQDRDADIKYIAAGKIPTTQVYKMYNILQQMIHKRNEQITQILRKNVTSKNEIDPSNHYAVKHHTTSNTYTYYEKITVVNNTDASEKLLKDEHGNIINKINFCGHSLGGNLAVIAGNILGNELTDYVYTFNGAGVTKLKGFLDFINGSSDYKMLFPYQVENFYSSEGKKIITGQLGKLFYPGSPTYEIFIEKTRNFIKQHSIIPLTKSLRIMALLESIDNSKKNTKEKIEFYGKIIKSSSAKSGEAMATLVNNLCKLFLNTKIQNSDLSNVFIDTNNFDEAELDRRVIKLEKNISSEGYVIHDACEYNFSFDNLSKAELFTILTGSSFVIQGVDYTKCSIADQLDEKIYSKASIIERANYVKSMLNSNLKC